MPDARSSRVLNRLVDIHGNANFVLDRFNSQREPLGRGDRIIVANIEALTIYADGSVPRQAGARNTPAPTELTLVVDNEPWIPIQVPAVDSIQNLEGNWDSELASHALIQIRNHLDSLVIDDYIATELCWVADGATTYHLNPAADSLEAADLLLARGLALRQNGTLLMNLLFVMDPLASAAAMSFDGWRTIESNDTFGAASVGRIYGVEVVETQAVRLSAQFAIDTAAVTGGGVTLTLTFTENPGLVVGQPVSTENLEAGQNVTDTPVLTVSTDGLTITVAAAGGDDADVTGANNVLIDNSAHNLLVDRMHVYTAVQKVPRVRIVNDPDTTGDIMQISALLGFIGRAGRAYVIHSPDDSL